MGSGRNGNQVNQLIKPGKLAEGAARRILYWNTSILMHGYWAEGKHMKYCTKIFHAFFHALEQLNQNLLASNYQLERVL